jgi:flavin reductase (DIM6/NTAB) family NADH-FMN oxidoreductase RutF
VRRAAADRVRLDGVAGRAPNLAPYSFFNAVGSNPMTMLFCPANTPEGGEKDTLRNAKPVEEGGFGEFVVNVATHELARRVAGAGESLAYGESEFELVGLTPEPSSVVRAPRVAESPVSFECRTRQVIRTNPGEPGGGNIVIGEVVWVRVREGLLNERMHADLDALDADRADGREGVLPDAGSVRVAGGEGGAGRRVLTRNRRRKRPPSRGGLPGG